MASLALRLVLGPGGEAPTVWNDYALPSPQWLSHRVTPGERMADTAARFAVRTSEITAWNEFARGTARVRPGTRLRIRARRKPPPRRRVTYVVERGDTWMEVAIRHRVEVRMLRALNWRTQKLVPGREIAIWIDPGAPRTVYRRRGPEVPDELCETPGATSIGRPQRGRIAGAVQLPAISLYTRLHPRWAWTTSHTAEHLCRAFASFRRRSGHDGEIVIGAISVRGGGAFAPHRSHQSGRDVDIRLPALPGADRQGRLRPEEVDWAATWALVRALLDTGEVAAIFLDRRLHRHLYQAARWQGAPRVELERTIQWATRLPPRGALVRHSKGHRGHIHVRFTCGRDEPRCRG